MTSNSTNSPLMRVPGLRAMFLFPFCAAPATAQVFAPNHLQTQRCQSALGASSTIATHTRIALAAAHDRLAQRNQRCARLTVSRIMPCLWYSDKAEEAAKFYASV